MISNPTPTPPKYTFQILCCWISLLATKDEGTIEGNQICQTENVNRALSSLSVKDRKLMLLSLRAHSTIAAVVRICRISAGIMFQNTKFKSFLEKKSF